jgi:hypothetical protein
MSILDKLREKFVEIFVGVVVIGLSGFILEQVYTLNGNQRATDEKVSGALGRLDRIASALPDVGVRVAQEETATPLQAAVVVADPLKNRAGTWVTPIHLIDIAAKERHTYLVPGTGPDDHTAAFLATGVGRQLDKDAVSFLALEQWSLDVKSPTSVPQSISSESSLALRRVHGDYAKLFDTAIRTAVPRTAVKTTDLKLEGVSWAKVAAEIANNSQAYAVAF